MLLVILFAKMALFAFYRVTSSSMENTLLVNDFLLVDKASYGAQTPNRVLLPFIDKTISLPSFELPALRQVKTGDVVVFRENDRFGNKMLVKRCIAVGGQIVEIRRKKVLVDGDEIDSIIAQSAGMTHAVNKDSVVLAADCQEIGMDSQGGINRDNFGPLTVPIGTIFVLGDNRDYSFDSRYFGVVDLTSVIGRAVMIYYSASDSSATGNGGINWTRLGKFIR